MLSSLLYDNILNTPVPPLVRPTMLFNRLVALLGALSTACAVSVGGRATTSKCVSDYTAYANVSHPPFSTGKYHLGYQRPPKECRTFVSAQVDKKIEDMKHVIADPDLYRLFENSYPNTLDTTVKWTGNASGSGDELTFIITGDMSVQPLPLPLPLPECLDANCTLT